MRYSPVRGLWSALMAEAFTSECLRLQILRVKIKSMPLAFFLALSSQIRDNLNDKWSNTSRLSDHYAFEKPNDRRALDLMNAAAVEVMKDLPDLCIAYGVSDEFRYADSILKFRLLTNIISFVFHPSCQLFERRNGWVLYTNFRERSLTTSQETGDHYCIYIYGVLHPLMEHVLPR